MGWSILLVSTSSRRNYKAGVNAKSHWSPNPVCSVQQESLTRLKMTDNLLLRFVVREMQTHDWKTAYIHDPEAGEEWCSSSSKSFHGLTSPIGFANCRFVLFFWKQTLGQGDWSDWELIHGAPTHLHLQPRTDWTVPDVNHAVSPCPQCIPCFIAILP